MLAVIPFLLVSSMFAEAPIDCTAFHLPAKTCKRLDKIIQNTPHTLGMAHRKGELPKQVLTTHFLKKGQNVLELGSNTGRNTMTIASILEGKSILYTSESNERDRRITQTNLHNNHLDFPNIHTIAAISKTPLEQKRWITRPQTTFGWLTGWSTVDTTPFPNFTFDVIVADCEGCLLPITEENPKLLQNATTIILENDWLSAEDDTRMHEKLRQHGFKTVYTHAGESWFRNAERKPMPKAQIAHFYEVLVKQKTNF